MQFSDLLAEAQIDPQTVIVFRHRPRERELRKVLPWLAESRPDVFNAYQQTQGPIVEKAMQRAKYVASFIGHKAGKAVFVGLYKVNGFEPLSYEEFWSEPTTVELCTKYRMKGMTDENSTVLWFDLVPLSFRREWKGKLIVCWPGRELSYWRWADRNEFTIHAILEDSDLERGMPGWRQLVLRWDELQTLPKSWSARLREWRGIYLIFDAKSGKSYVGAAYGNENLLGRWSNYAASGDGGNKHLKKCDPKCFRFSILQRVSPDASEQKVTRLERTWMKRLHTRSPSGLND
jgi:hypothetical protein